MAQRPGGPPSCGTTKQPLAVRRHAGFRCRIPTVPERAAFGGASTKELRDDGSIIEVVIWELPEPLAPSMHRYKYRLYFGWPGREVVRYDNERGKGDHRHLGGRELPYAFTSVEQLLDDFESDIRQGGRS